VRTLVQERVTAGEHVVNWDGRSADEQELPSGIYVARLATSDGLSFRKMILAK
jgi:flagellar hook assembly protein FlgD